MSQAVLSGSPKALESLLGDLIISSSPQWQWGDSEAVLPLESPSQKHYVSSIVEDVYPDRR